jgi:hypothetical protein
MTKNSWVIDKLADRLDAEYYWKPNAKKAYRSVSSVQQDVSTSLAKINDEYVIIGREIDRVLREHEYRSVRLDELLEQVEVPVSVMRDESYRLLGVRWWGEGAFVRESVTGGVIKAKKLYRVSTGWVVYNRLFAKRGSFAVLNEEHEGCYVSAEFPTFKVRDGINNSWLIARYIVHCLNSPQGIEEVDALSTGSTKRSRGRLTEAPFLGMEVRIPVLDETLETLVNLLDRAMALRPEVQKLLDRTKELAESVSLILPRPYVAERESANETNENKS